MELMGEVKGHSDREEEDEDEAVIIREEISSSSKHYCPLNFSPSLSSSSPSTNHLSSNHHHQNSWLGLHDHYQYPEATTPADFRNSSSGLGLHHQDANHRKLEFVDLSLGNKEDNEANFHGGAGTSITATTDVLPIEKEHMFDKVVTPSDVGKLNRLVIPKQHAEKYFPLDSSSNEKGLLLNFEDRNGKLWRFRYSYWNSSQSYVMTKGWSRFVKEKKLDAGDIVSFQRGAGELYRHRLYIDWRRRPDHHLGRDPTSITPLLLPNQSHLSQYSIRWGGRLYSVPPAAPAEVPPHHHHEHLQQVNYSNMYPFRQQQHHQYHNGSHHQSYNDLNLRSGAVYYLRSTPTMGAQNLIGQQEGRNSPMIIDSVPVAHHHQHHHGKSNSNTRTAAKRLRLFGVNMECASSSSPAEEPKCCLLSSTSANMAGSLPSSSLQYLRLPHGEDPLTSSSSSSSRFQNQKGEIPMLFGLDPSLQYRQ